MSRYRVTNLSRGIVVAGFLVLGSGACAAPELHDPLTAREVIEAAANATKDVHSLRFTGDFASDAEYTDQYHDLLSSSLPWLHVEGIWVGPDEYKIDETHYLDSGDAVQVETVSKQNLTISRRLGPEGYNWQTNPTALISGRPLYTPVYGVTLDFADHIVSMDDSDIDGVPVYIVKVVRPLDTPEERNAPRVSIDLYIGKTDFLVRRHHGRWDMTELYDLADRPSVGEPRIASIDWRFSDFNAADEITFPEDWDSANQGRGPVATPSPTPFSRP